MVHLTVLGSGSSGNCAVISTERTTLLLDAGLSAKQICLRLDACASTPRRGHLCVRAPRRLGLDAWGPRPGLPATPGP
jgi:phosphoribosyl 1,2-cyclic phosphodiesterase